MNAFPIIAMVKYADIQCCVMEVKYCHTDFVNFWKRNQESAIASSQIQKQCSAFSYLNMDGSSVKKTANLGVYNS